MKKVSQVFWYALIICVLLVLWGSVFPDNLMTTSARITEIFYDLFGWYYMFVVIFMVGTALFVVFTRFGKIKLGDPDEEPDFSMPAWFAMLFSAGMGIGLVFFTTAETISHAFISTPEAPAGSDQAIEDSLQFTSLHWGLHGWGMYSVVALILAYFNFRKRMPGLISATLTPIFGEKAMKGIAGTIIDTLAVFATIVGVASTLGLGSSQINGGLNYLFNVPITYWVQLVILVVATVLFILSAWSGLGNGIRYLSTINMGIAGLLILVLFIVGPSLYILDMFTTSIGNYLSNFLDMSFQMRPMDQGERDWLNNWTLFYWAWWISWSPFVGMFIARVSKGRTIREFVIGVMLAPTLVTFVFFAVFGSSALNLERVGAKTLSALPTEAVTFGMFEHYPLGTIMSFITVVVIAIFFITSADSATFVLGMFTTKGSLNPGNWVKIVWGLILSSIAAIVSYYGGLDGFQNLLIITALPFSFIILLMVVSFYKEGKKELQNKK